jgi:hypothetical protein
MEDTIQFNIRIPRILKQVLDKAAKQEGPLGQRRYTSTGVLAAEILRTWMQAHAECQSATEVSPYRIFGARFGKLYAELYEGSNDHGEQTGV